MMKPGILSILLFVIAGAAPAAPTEKPESAGLRISTEVQMVARPTINSGEPGPFKVFYHFDVVTLLENVGNTPIRIPTTEPDVQRTKRFDSSGKVLVTSYCFGEARTREGKRVVVSECEYSPVTLAPGEVAMLVPVRDESVNLSFNQQPKRRAPVWVFYSVDQDLAKRYGWWHGEISAVAKEEFGVKEPPDLDSKGVDVKPTQQRAP